MLLDYFAAGGWLGLTLLLTQSCGKELAPTALPNVFGQADAGTDARTIEAAPDRDAEPPLPDESGSWTWRACGTIGPSSNAPTEQTTQAEFVLGGSALVAVLGNGSILRLTVDESG